MIQRPLFKRLCNVLILAVLLNLPGGVCAIKFLEGCSGYGCFAIFFAACLYLMWLVSYLLYFVLLLSLFRNRSLRIGVLLLPALVSVAVLVVTWKELDWPDEFTTSLLMVLMPNIAVPFISIGVLGRKADT